MSLDSLSITLSQIKYLVSNLSKRNYKTSVQELVELVSSQGPEADRYLLRCLLSEVDLSSDAVRTPNSKDFQQVQLLAQECAVLLRKPSLISTLVNAVDKAYQYDNIKNPAQLLPTLSKILKFTTVQEVVFGLTLLHSSYQVISEAALQFVKQRLPLLIRSYSTGDSRNTKPQEGGLQDSTPEVLHFILTYLFTPKDQIFLGITPETKEILIESLRRDFPRELVPVVLAPLLYWDKVHCFQMDSIVQESTVTMPKNVDESLPTLIMDVGYNFCSTLEDARQQMSSLGMRDVSASVVARILIMMVRTNSGDDELPVYPFWSRDVDKTLDNSGNLGSAKWNIDIFIQALKEYSPNLMWTEVIRELDQSDLVIKDRHALSLLFGAFRLGLELQGCSIDKFPVEYLYKEWKHNEPQTQLLCQIVKNPDVFCLLDYPHRAVATDILKSVPEPDNKEINAWRNLDLIETLLTLSDRGMSLLVQDILRFPIQNCPDLLMLGLLQLTIPLNQARSDLMMNLITVFLANHPNSGVILHQAWNSQNVAVKTLIMQAMADWYTKGDSDQIRLSRILDVAHDLKALSLLLNIQSYPFVIDLACLASRREYLKLEKWVTDKIRDHGEIFVSALVKFLQRRCPQLFGGTYKDEVYPKAAQLPQEIISTILTCLQSCVGNVSAEVSEAIMNLLTTCTFLVNKTRPLPQGVVRANRNLEQSFSPGALFPPNPPQLDVLNTLGASLSNLNIGVSQTTAPFNLAGLNPLVSAPGSPSRLMGPPPNTNYTILPQLIGTLGNQMNLGSTPLASSSVAGINTLARLAPQTTSAEKLRIGDTSVTSASSMLPESSVTVTKEVEDEANGYFQRIYNHSTRPALTPDEVIELLKKFHQSPVKRERELFVCMVRNLFEEYKFFSQYPDKELQITAQLFGGILAHGLLTQSQFFGAGLKCILDALKKSPNSKMFTFGVGALEQLKPILKDIPKMCEYISSIQHFSELPTNVIEYVEYGAQGKEPPHKAVTTTAPVLSSTVFKTTVSNSTTSASIVKVSGQVPSFTSTSIDTLLIANEKQEKVIAPAESLQDKIAFIFNNLSQLNVHQKTEEVRAVMEEEYLPWLSQYLVMKRASIESNFHHLYSGFIDAFKRDDFEQMIINESYRNIKVLLQCDKTTDKFSDRTLLKNLGHWLGVITLAKNKPVLCTEIDLQALLVEGYQRGSREMLYVLPFVAKVLESCMKSTVFKPPNPWTMGIMRLFGEIHKEPDLKLTLKFEIEVLCKTLQLDLQDLKPRFILKRGEMLDHAPSQLSKLPPQHQQKKHVTSSPVTSGTGQSLSLQPCILPSGIPANIGNVTASSPVQHAMSTTPVSTPAEEILFQMGQLALAPPHTSVTPVPPILPDPKFNLFSFSISTVPALGAHLVISSQITLFQAHPALKQCVRTVFERTVQEWLLPVIDRSTKISVNTTHQIVKNDFALDPEESRMRTAAQYMVRNLSAGMALVTCREHISNNLSLGLKQMFLTVLTKNDSFQQQLSLQQKELIEAAANTCVNDNIELACAFVQKQVIDRAAIEIDRCLQAEYDKRKTARMEGRCYCDAGVLTYQVERMPEMIRLKVGGVSSLQMAVYENLGRNVPGFRILTDRESAALVPKPLTPTVAYNANDEVATVYDKITSDLELYIQSVVTNQIPQSSHPGIPTSSPFLQQVHELLDALILVRRSGSRDTTAGVTIVQKSLEGLADGLSPRANTDVEAAARYRDFYIRVLKSLQDARAFGSFWTNQKVTKALVTEVRDDIRFNMELLDILLKARLINFQHLDIGLASNMENGMNYTAVAYAMQIVQHYLIDEKHSGLITEKDLSNTIETLLRIVSNQRNPQEGLAGLTEILRSNVEHSNLFLGTVDRPVCGAISFIHSGILQSRELDDPPGLFEKTEYLLREWMNIYNTIFSKDQNKAFTSFLNQLNTYGVLKSDDTVTRFFRLSLTMIIDLFYRIQSGPHLTTTRISMFHTMDAFIKLIALLIRNSGEVSNTVTKLNLLNKIVGLISGVLIQDHEARGNTFHQLPYHRMFAILFSELTCSDPILESISFQVISAFAHNYHILRPQKIPCFSFAWLDLIADRVFMARMLAVTPQQKGWSTYAQLVVDVLKFMMPFFRNVKMSPPVSVYYKGLLRFLLVLLHDFPEFLCEYHYGFCDVLPPNCVQLRNIVLSAFPRSMRLPDPFTPNLKIDQLGEIALPPRMSANFTTTLPQSFKKELDSYLKARAPVTFLSELRTHLQSSEEQGSNYNIALMNSLVLYVGTQAIAELRMRNLGVTNSTIAHTAHMDILQNLAVDLDSEGRYLFFNAIANHLRYPNSHTHYFSCAMLYLFGEANSAVIQEQITRILLERIIVNRPHPWGLLITFIELIKNPLYRFWTQDFVHCAPEIERLFESVAHSCVVRRNLISHIEAGGLLI